MEQAEPQEQTAAQVPPVALAVAAEIRHSEHCLPHSAAEADLAARSQRPRLVAVEAGEL